MNDRIELSDALPVIKEVVDGGGTFRIYPHGTSMLPTLREGIDSVTLAKPERIGKGDIILYRRQNGAFVLHRVAAVVSGSYVCIGDNQVVSEFGVPRGAVIAVVSEYEHGGIRVKRGGFLFKLHRLRARSRAGLRLLYQETKTFFKK